MRPHPTCSLRALGRYVEEQIAQAREVDVEQKAESA